MCFPCVQLGVSYDIGKDILDNQWSFMTIIMNSHETLVHCWWLKTVIKVWVSILWFFFSDCVFIFVFKSLLLFVLTIFSVLFLCINNVSSIMGISLRVDVFIWVFKADWVYIWSMTINSILRSSCVVFISFFVVFLGLDPFLW